MSRLSIAHFIGGGPSSAAGCSRGPKHYQGRCVHLPNQSVLTECHQFRRPRHDAQGDVGVAQGIRETDGNLKSVQTRKRTRCPIPRHYLPVTIGIKSLRPQLREKTYCRSRDFQPPNSGIVIGELAYNAPGRKYWLCLNGVQGVAGSIPPSRFV